MEEFKVTARIEHLDGLAFSDPSYDRDVWCRYEHVGTIDDWEVELRAKEVTEKYEDMEFQTVAFSLALSRDAFTRDVVSVGEDLRTLSYIRGFEVVEVEIGMDTACVWCGVPGVEPGGWQPEGSLCTGTDGSFATAYEFKKDGELYALVLLGEVDPLFASPESLWEFFKEGLQAK